MISQVHQWMESPARISTDSIFLLVLYKAVIIFILSVIMEAFRSVIMEAFKEVLYDETTEEWYAQCDPDEVEHEEHNCMHSARQFYYRVQRMIFHLCTLSITNTEHSSISRELPSTICQSRIICMMIKR